MEENKNVLDEINKGACMGKDSIHYILDKVANKKLKNLDHKLASIMIAFSLSSGSPPGM